ncbi:MAG: four-helix bundle copper-binding protein [Pirellula sp.]|jgi:hypothetical protein
MDRRKMIGALGAAGAASFALARNVSGQERNRRTLRHATMRNPVDQECLDACVRCEIACNEMVHHCLMQAGNGVKEHVRVAEIALTCQEFCGLAAKLIARSCEMRNETCQLCAKVCDACADECEKNEADKEMMACDEVCRQCAAACRKMA